MFKPQIAHMFQKTLSPEFICSFLGSRRLDEGSHFTMSASRLELVFGYSAWFFALGTREVYDIIALFGQEWRVTCLCTPQKYMQNIPGA